jgi:hypothetical protein
MKARHQAKRQGNQGFGRDLRSLEHTATKETNMNMLRFTQGLVISLIALLVFATALARPDVQTFSNHVQSTLIDCGGFLAVDDYTEEVRIYTFFDRQNSPINMLVHVTTTGTIANGENGKSLPDQGELLIWRNLNGDSVAVSSLFYGTAISGVDTVYRSAGKVSFRDGLVSFDGASRQLASRGNGHMVHGGGNSYFVTGSQQTASGDFASLCSALR